MPRPRLLARLLKEKFPKLTLFPLPLEQLLQPLEQLPQPFEQLPQLLWQPQPPQLLQLFWQLQQEQLQPEQPESVSSEQLQVLQV